MKLGKIFICINILVLSLLMLRNGLELFIKILVIDLTSIIVLLAIVMILWKPRIFSILLQNDKSFAIGEKYIEIGRVTYAVAI